jgi:pimeloyl-ACP methyl ester carboxylesterase
LKVIQRNGVGLAFDDAGQGEPVILVHGWGCNRAFFAPQSETLSARHRVVTVDLRGHGASDAPEQEYSLRGFAEDLAWLCSELNLRRPILVGHSMGGNIVLEFAARFPELARGVVLIDSALFLPANMVNELRPFAEALRTIDYEGILRAATEKLFLPTDDPTRKEWISSAMAKTPSYVLASAYVNHITEYDASSAAERCRVPTAYIGSANPLGDITKFRAKCPHVIVGQTLGSGHFSPLEVPDQINSMLLRFVSLCA